MSTKLHSNGQIIPDYGHSAPATIAARHTCTSPSPISPTLVNGGSADSIHRACRPPKICDHTQKAVLACVANFALAAQVYNPVFCRMKLKTTFAPSRPYAPQHILRLTFLFAGHHDIIGATLKGLLGLVFIHPLIENYMQKKERRCTKRIKQPGGSRWIGRTMIDSDVYLLNSRCKY